MPSQSRQPPPLLAVYEVKSSFFQGVVGRAKNRILESPEFGEPCICAVSGGEENIGVQKQAVHTIGAVAAEPCQGRGRVSLPLVAPARNPF